jgi:pimeloyl-ACP methyl ester carboxylesterase
MLQPIPVQKRVVQANGTDLYCEMHGRGPAVLFICGATGDAGHFERVAGHLADAFTVITYDRRGNSRSPAPAGWTQTTIEEQANDAAALIQALGVGPVGVFGTSSGGAIGLELLLRHPEVVRGAVLHEPFLPAVCPEQASPGLSQVQSRINTALAAGGPRAAVEAFFRAVAGESVYEGLDPELRERMLGNGETLLFLEMPIFSRYRPQDAVVSAIQQPMWVLQSSDTLRSFRRPICEWLARLAHTEVGGLLGGHACYLDRPEETARRLRPYLQQLTGLQPTEQEG